MFSSHNLSRNVLIFVLIIMILLVGKVATPEPVKAATPTDGRINLIPWVNSWGAVAVYCIDKNGGTRSFTGGGIKILSSNGQQLYFAAEEIIIAAQKLADRVGRRILIRRQGLYYLYALPNGYFELDTVPDAEGKSFLARWYGCVPVGPGPEPAGPTCNQFPKELLNCQNFSECFAFNNGDPNCDGNIQDAADRDYCNDVPC